MHVLFIIYINIYIFIFRNIFINDHSSLSLLFISFKYITYILTWNSNFNTYININRYIHILYLRLYEGNKHSERCVRSSFRHAKKKKQARGLLLQQTLCCFSWNANQYRVPYIADFFFVGLITNANLAIQMAHQCPGTHLHIYRCCCICCSSISFGADKTFAPHWSFVQLKA